MPTGPTASTTSDRTDKRNSGREASRPDPGGGFLLPEDGTCRRARTMQTAVQRMTASMARVPSLSMRPSALVLKSCSPGGIQGTPPPPVFVNDADTRGRRQDDAQGGLLMQPMLCRRFLRKVKQVSSPGKNVSSETATMNRTHRLRRVLPPKMMRKRGKILRISSFLRRAPKSPTSFRQHQRCPYAALPSEVFLACD